MKITKYKKSDTRFISDLGLKYRNGLIDLAYSYYSSFKFDPYVKTTGVPLNDNFFTTTSTITISPIVYENVAGRIYWDNSYVSNGLKI